MMRIFKKRDVSDTTTLYSPASGKLMHIEDVNDPMFSQKMMGDGYAVYPKNGTITSPVSGKIISIFPTKHAIGILSDNGDEVILHIGINTVDLNGKPFEIFIKENQKVKASTTLVEMDLAMLEQLQIDPTVIVVVTNMDDDAMIQLHETTDVTNQETVGLITK
ncbi:PTS system IIA component (Glc family) [Breznakia blatticola]|uniref:PTS system IIA component (Glc family) n=1 Tax=Breznakia blatticola TaxID=1754012 RepID=A0A4R7ZIC6_9FIRM|nr:PTS glucose transporter subunit IIA [Breznakia blatticola]TDW16181.1 PTS system IIA component (Glc family) [Breznakia blatticola]